MAEEEIGVKIHKISYLGRTDCNYYNFNFSLHGAMEFFVSWGGI
jgi:hypothetical protein